MQVVLKKRDANNAFQQIWSLIVDPKDMFVDTSVAKSMAPLLQIQKSGDPADKVDFLILGDGYTNAELKKFESDARRLTELLFATSPFKERRKDFNVWALCPPAEVSGISRPSIAASALAPRIRYCDARGPAPQLTYFFTVAGASGASGRGDRASFSA